MDTLIRFANEHDLNSCIDLDLHKKEKTILNKIHQKEVIVCELNNEIIGCLKFEYIWTHLPFISYIVIKDKFQNIGIGSKMLLFLENYLRKTNCTFLLSSTMTNAPSSQRWHMAKGFNECGILCGINTENIGEIFYKKAL